MTGPILLKIVFFTAFGLLVYIYWGYGQLLRLAVQGASKRTGSVGNAVSDFPILTVLVTAHNEEASIKERIDNILACEYPKDRLEIVVASDGSTDATDGIVLGYKDVRVRLFRPPERIGKTATQNRAIEGVAGEVVLFTDADTRFEEGCLLRMAAPFADSTVGGATGNLLVVSDYESGVSLGQSFYWSYELRLRQYESDLNILAVATGACMAVRRSLFRPMEAAYGEDCIVPLDVVHQGYRFVHVKDAIAYDRMPHESAQEFRTRVRMTFRNWRGTWSRKQLLNPVVFPLVAWALWSHKMLRWLSPVFLLLITLSAFALGGNGAVFTGASVALGAFYGLGVLGWLCEHRHWRIPVVGQIYGFLLANAGFMVGVGKAIIARTDITVYR